MGISFDIYRFTLVDNGVALMNEFKYLIANFKDTAFFTRTVHFSLESCDMKLRYIC